MSEAIDSTKSPAFLFDKIWGMILDEAKKPARRKVDLRDYDIPSPEELIEKYGEGGDGVEFDQDDETGEYYFAYIPVERANPRQTFYVAVDCIEKSYGGPQEGGWWYDSGTVREFEPIRVLYDGAGEPYIDAGELSFLRSIAKEWVDKFESFETNYRSSMRPKGDDYRLRVTVEPPEDWSGYQPYC